MVRTADQAAHQGFLKRRQSEALVVMKVRRRVAEVTSGSMTVSEQRGGCTILMIADGTIINDVLDWESRTLDLHYPLP